MNDDDFRRDDELGTVVVVLVVMTLAIAVLGLFSYFDVIP